VYAIYVQVYAHLASKLKTADSLLSHPPLADAFTKINSTLPSSAAVERLLSDAAQVLTSRHCRMSDVILEQQIFLRSQLKLGSDDKTD